MDDASARPFGFWMTTALVVGSMIGAGIFVLPAQFGLLGATGIVAWIVAVAGSLFIAHALVALLLTRPQSTGLVDVCGEVLGPVVGVLLGWSYCVGIWAANAVIAIVGVRYLTAFVPWIDATPFHTALSACATVWLLTLLNLLGVKEAGRFQVVATAIKLLPLIAVVAILAGLMLAGGGQFAATPHAAFDAALLTPALAPAFLALCGFEGATVVAERVRDPARIIPLATIAGLVLTGLLFLIVCSGIVYAMPEQAVANASAPIAMFVEMFWGHWAALAIAAFAAVSAIGCLNGWILLQGEVPLGMARAGLLPRWFAAVSARDVPFRLQFLSSLATTILIMSNATQSARGLLDFMLRLTASTAMWFYIGGCVAALVVRIAPRSAAIGLLFSCWTMWSAGLEAGALGLGLTLTALPLYWLRPKLAPPDSAAVEMPALGR
jgi:APA family basic amino acid/polyamine antiporter